MGEHRPGQRPGRRLTLTEAAEQLGMSRDAVRMRVRRGSLASEKGEDGRVYVFVEPDQVRAQDAAQHHADHAGHAYPQPEGRQHADSLVEELRDQVGYLREQLRREQDAHAEARRIIAALTQRIPETEAPAPSEAPGPATEQPGRVEAQQQVEGTQEVTERP
jgi:hypothetical protein